MPIPLLHNIRKSVTKKRNSGPIIHVDSTPISTGLRRIHTAPDIGTSQRSSLPSATSPLTPDPLATEEIQEAENAAFRDLAQLLYAEEPDLYTAVTDMRQKAGGSFHGRMAVAAVRALGKEEPAKSSEEEEAQRRQEEEDEALRLAGEDAARQCLGWKTKLERLEAECKMWITRIRTLEKETGIDGDWELGPRLYQELRTGNTMWLGKE